MSKLEAKKVVIDMKREDKIKKIAEGMKKHTEKYSFPTEPKKKKKNKDD